MNDYQTQMLESVTNACNAMFAIWVIFLIAIFILNLITFFNNSNYSKQILEKLEETGNLTVHHTSNTIFKK